MITSKDIISSVRSLNDLMKELLVSVKSLKDLLKEMFLSIKSMKDIFSLFKSTKTSTKNEEHNITPPFANLQNEAFELVGLHPYREYHFLLLENCITIGRSSSINTFPIPDNSLSRTHVKIRFDNNLRTIEDLNSTNGTLVNNKLLQKNQRITIYDGDIIQLGSVKLKYRKTHS